MGYYSGVDGRIEITPPLRWADVRDSEFLTRGANARNCVAFEVEETAEDTDDGTVTVKRAVAIVPAWEDDAKFYRIQDELGQIVSLALRAPGGPRELTGHLVRTGDEQGDVERYRVENGRVATEKASLRWPDGTEVDL